MGSKRQEKEKVQAAPATTNTRVATVADLLHRVASSCLSQRLPGTRTFDDDDDEWSSGSSINLNVNEEDVKKKKKQQEDSDSTSISIARAIAKEEEEDEDDEEQEEHLQLPRLRIWEQEQHKEHKEHREHREHREHKEQSAPPPKDQLQLQMMVSLLSHVFHSLSALKRAYRTLQQAHCPWDPLKIHSADAALISELRKLDTLRDRFRRATHLAHTTHPSPGPTSLSDAVAPYEAALHDLQNELKLKDSQLQNLRHKLAHSDLLAATVPTKGHSRSHSARWATFSKGLGKTQPSSPLSQPNWTKSTNQP